MGAVSERCIFGSPAVDATAEQIAAAELAYLKSFIQIEHSEDDTLITDMLKTAKSEADSILLNPFNTIWDEHVGWGDASETAFTLSQAPDLYTEKVYVSGELLDHTAYTISGTTLMFVSAPAARAKITVDFEADQDIPEAVKSWVARRTAHLYEFRVQGTKRIVETGVGSVELDDFPYTDLMPFRLTPGF